MSRESITVQEKLLDYIRSVSLRPNEKLEMVREKTITHPAAKMMITPEQAQFMTMLMQLLGVKNALEIGVFTGYSTLATALGMPDDGKIIALDRSHEWTSRALKHWHDAGVDDKIDLRIGDGPDLLEELVKEGREGSFDFIFIDADKKNYETYYEYAYRLIKDNGLIMIDNTLWRGDVVRKESDELALNQVKSFNEHVFNDQRVDVTILPMADGITLVRKK
jgi:predicted O-methyltransferase YrrM